MGPEVGLFEHTDADPVAHPGPDQVLQVQRRPVERIEIIEFDRLPTGFELAVIAAVRPVWMVDGIMPDAKIECSTPSRTRLKAASITRLTG
jgi:hypothetical protein